MRWSDLENFTYEELSSFTFEEFSLEASELLQKMKGDNRPVPFSVVQKLHELCTAVNNEPVMETRITIEINEPKKKMSVGDVASIIGLILNLLVSYPLLRETYFPIIVRLLKWLQSQL